jgi:hypothetical protein
MSCNINQWTHSSNMWCYPAVRFEVQQDWIIYYLKSELTLTRCQLPLTEDRRQFHHQCLISLFRNLLLYATFRNTSLYYLRLWKTAPNLVWTASILTRDPRRIFRPSFLRTYLDVSLHSFIHSFCSLSYGRSVASSKASSPQGAI